MTMKEQSNKKLKFEISNRILHSKNSEEIELVELHLEVNKEIPPATHGTKHLVGKQK